MSLLLKLKSSFFTKTKITKICFIGLDKAGKSSILRWILEERFDELSNKRTVGMEVAKFQLSGLEFVAWDIGGQKAFRETIWQSYLLGTKAIIYVIDSTDTNRLQESKSELDKFVFNNPKFVDVPILLLANKQDLPGALSVREIETILNLKHQQTITCKVFEISCKTGLNIQESFNWLCNQINYTEKRMHYNPSHPMHSVNV